jgi:hypothetical protein
MLSAGRETFPNPFVAVLQTVASERSVQAGCALCGTPLVEISVRKKWETAAIDSTPPSVELEGLGSCAALTDPLRSEIARTAEAQVEPVDRSTFPEDPDDVTSVPPFPCGSVPVT